MYLSAVAASAQEILHNQLQLILIYWRLKTARIPKEYTIRSINVTGLITSILLLFFLFPDFRLAIKLRFLAVMFFQKLLRTYGAKNFFLTFRFLLLRLQESNIDIEINVQERPKLGNFKFIGVKKTEAEELTGKIRIGKVNHHYRKYKTKRS